MNEAINKITCEDGRKSFIFFITQLRLQFHLLKKFFFCLPSYENEEKFLLFSRSLFTMKLLPTTPYNYLLQRVISIRAEICRKVPEQFYRQLVFVVVIKMKLKSAVELCICTYILTLYNSNIVLHTFYKLLTLREKKSLCMLIQFMANLRAFVQIDCQLAGCFAHSLLDDILLVIHI